MSRKSHLTVLFALTLCATSLLAVSGPSVNAQLDAIAAEKAARTPGQRKLDSQLLFLGRKLLTHAKRLGSFRAGRARGGSENATRGAAIRPLQRGNFFVHRSVERATCRDVVASAWRAAATDNREVASGHKPDQYLSWSHATMKEFKFNCPACGQHILAPAESSGRKINCPSCQGSITIPSVPAETKKPTTKPVSAPVPATASSSPPKPSGGGLPGEAPKKSATPTVSPPPAKAPSSKASGSAPVVPEGPVAKPKPVPATPESPEQVRLSVLTPGIRLEMVRAVRKRIAAESTWLPAKIEGDLAYAAKTVDGKPVVVDVKSPEATRFSLIGAFRREFQLRKVVGTAPGRREILDEEIPEAIREVLLGDKSEEEREKAGDPMANKDRPPLSHPQCLEALDILEDRYLKQMEALQEAKAKRKLGTVRLSDLVPKLEQKARISPEDVATALYHELTEVRKRLDRLEKNSKLVK